MSNLATELGHLKNDVMYPADRKAILAACNNMSDYPKEDRDWFSKTLPEGKYTNAHDVLQALLAKV
jgi:hypothetical protein